MGVISWQYALYVAIYKLSVKCCSEEKTCHTLLPDALSINHIVILLIAPCDDLFRKRTFNLISA